MKHPARVVLVILAVWIVAQVIGLFIVEHYATSALPAGVSRPQLSASEVPWYMLIGIAIGTGLVLVLARFRQRRLWALWFGIAVFMLSYIALSAFLPSIAALVVSLAFVWLKIDKRLHWALRNVPELFLYGGIAAIFAPMLTVPIALIILAGISVYDAIAVWQSKHMIALARFQMDSGLFAGFSMPKAADPDAISARGATDRTARKKNALARTSKAVPSAQANGTKTTGSTKTSKHASGSAILGGGDFAFPLVYTSTLLMWTGWIPAVAATVGGYLGLLFLFSISKDGRFYPAMPFLAVGLVLGTGLGFVL